MLYLVIDVSKIKFPKKVKNQHAFTCKYKVCVPERKELKFGMAYIYLVLRA